MRLIILDTETTGLSPAEGRIVEIAAVEMLDGKLTGREFHHLLNPEHPISEEITEITGINDAMVAGRPTFSGTSKNRRFQPATVSSGLKSSGLPVL